MSTHLRYAWAIAYSEPKWGLLQDYKGNVLAFPTKKAAKQFIRSEDPSNSCHWKPLRLIPTTWCP